MELGDLKRHLLRDAVVGIDIAAVAGSHNHTQSQITDLEHDATEIRSVTVANSGPGDNMLLTFDAALGEWVPEAGTGHTHVEANITDLLHDATKIQSVAVGTGAPAADNLLTFDDVSGTWRPEAASGHSHDATYAPIAKGVTNGDSHDHAGGDGAQIAHSGLSALDYASAGHTGFSADTHTHTATYAVKDFADGIAFPFGNGTSVVSVGAVLLIPIPYACTIQNFITVADTASTAEIDILKTSANSMPHGAGDSIVASVPPSLSNSVVQVNATLTGWTTAIAANDVLKASVTSCNSANLLTVMLGMVRV